MDNKMLTGWSGRHVLRRAVFRGAGILQRLLHVAKRVLAFRHPLSGWRKKLSWDRFMQICPFQLLG